MTNTTSTEEIYGDSEELRGPRTAKGGTFAPADIKLIKEALIFYAKHNGNITDSEERQTVNLLHRLNRIGG